MSWFSKGAADAAAQGLSKDAKAQLGSQVLKAGSQALPGGQQFQFFPVQVGGPTPYARSRKPHFVIICIYQALMAALALIEFANFLSGIIMILGCLVAFWAFKEDMNITYICWWGVLCTAGFIAGLVGAFIGFAVMLTTIILKFNIPISCLIGMALAWNLYSDYELEKQCNDHVGSWLRALGLLKEPPPPPPTSTNALNGWLPQFGNSTTGVGNSITGNVDAIKSQMGSYGAMGREQVTAYEKQMAGYGRQAEEQAANLGSQAYGKVGQVGPVPQGRQDVRSDPFMTL